MLNPRTTRWTLLANLGAGATTLDMDEFDGDDIAKTYCALGKYILTIWKKGYRLVR